MRVALLTRNVHGLAGLFLSRPLPDDVELVGVLVDEGAVTDRRAYVLRRLRKIRRIGLDGALTGLALRRVYRMSGMHPAPAIAPRMYRFPSLNDEAARRELRELGPDVAVSLDNRLIEEETFDLPPLGTINVHHGHVPVYRGGPPVFWELKDGSDTVGFTIHRIDAGIDTGDVLAEGSVAIQRRPSLEQTLRATIPPLHEASLDALDAVLRGLARGEDTPRVQLPSNVRARTTPRFKDYLHVRRSLRG